MKHMKIPNTMSTIPLLGKLPIAGFEWKQFQSRFPTAEEVSSWETEARGIVTGKLSKVLVVDDDGGLDLKKYPMPRTLTQNTPSGGKHYFFKWSDALDLKVTQQQDIFKTGEKHKNVDTRGEGGYVCFYGFNEIPGTIPIANPPKWLLDLLPNKEAVSSGSSTALTTTPWLVKQLEEIEPGAGSRGRTPTFIRVIGQLKNRGLDKEEIVGILMPWAEKYDYKGLEELIEDQFKRYPPSVAPVAKVETSSNIEAFLEDTEKVEWLCEGLIAKRSIGFIAGLPESRKSWIMMDLAIEVARGGVWLEKFKLEKAKVLLIDQERFKGETQRRLKCLLNAKSISTTSIKTVLDVKCGTTIRLNLQNSFDAFKRELSELRPELIIFDSFATAHTSEENNRQSIQEVLEKVKELRNEFGCTFLFVHHENKLAFSKDEGDPSIAQMSGNIAIPAAAEMVLTVRKQDSESSMVYNTKNTLAPSMAPFLVKVEDIDKNKIKVKAY